MSDTLREAENLLKTIVSSNARLSSLRGTPEHPAETTDLVETVPETPKIQEDTTTAPGNERVDTIAHEPPSETRTEDPEDPWALGVNIDRRPAPTTEVPSAEGSAEPTFDDRDFSFLDLIPSDTRATEASEPESASEPLDIPPPVRAKPVMPLPLGLAAGAPTTTPASQNAQTPRTEPSAPRPEPSPQRTPVHQDPSPYDLSAPRAVTPRVLDPDRERLEVEVYGEMEPEGDLPEQPPPDAPRLTEADPTQENHRNPTPVTPQEHPEEAIFDALTQAKDSIGRGDLANAHVHLTDVLDWEPAHVEARLARGRCSRDIGDPIAAMSDFEKAIQVAPFSPEAHVEMGDLFFARKDYGRAIQHYTDAIERDPNHPMALVRRGMCHHYRQHPADALDDLRSAQIAAPDMPNIDRYIRMVSTPKRR
jgi:hypothetical protein